MLNKRSIVLLTNQDYNEWLDIWKFDDLAQFSLRQLGSEVEEFENLNVLLDKLPGESDMIVIWLNGYKYRNAQENVREDLLRIIEKLVGFSIIVAVHGWEHLEVEKLITSSFSSLDKKNYEEILLKLKTESNFKNKFDEAWDYLRKRFITANLSYIKYLIAHLWLSLDIDLEGIQIVLTSNSEFQSIQEKEKKAINYLKEVLNNKNSHYYLQKIVNLRYAITGDDESAVENLNVTDDFKNLIEFSIKELRLDDEYKKKWEILLKLNCFNGTKHIIEFMKVLDEKIPKANDVTLDETIEILDFFKSKKWKIAGASPEIIESFHDWFSALNNCLDTFEDKT